jgi:hypothetical protein
MMIISLTTSLLLSLAAQASSGTAAMDAKGKSLPAGEVISNGHEVRELVARDNTRLEAAPKAVFEFTEEGKIKLFRGSLLVENEKETSLLTSGGKVDFNGKAIVSFDAKSKSTSVFVLEGEARLVSPTEKAHSIRMQRFQGATLELGDVLPQLTSQLELSGLKSWLKGYAWPETKVNDLLASLPHVLPRAHDSTPAHIADTKLEDYFSSIDTEDDSQHQPTYYEEKFKDPDIAMLEAKSRIEGARVMSPEEAALISLPSTKIETGLEFLSAAKKKDEVAGMTDGRAKAKGRSLASIKSASPKKEKAEVSDGLDPEVRETLQRLKGIKPESPVISGAEPSTRARGPASVSGAVPDLVYDYSQNF